MRNTKWEVYKNNHNDIQQDVRIRLNKNRCKNTFINTGITLQEKPLQECLKCKIIK